MRYRRLSKPSLNLVVPKLDNHRRLPNPWARSRKVHISTTLPTSTKMGPLIQVSMTRIMLNHNHIDHRVNTPRSTTRRGQVNGSDTGRVTKVPR